MNTNQLTFSQIQPGRATLICITILVSFSIIGCQPAKPVPDNSKASSGNGAAGATQLSSTTLATVTVEGRSHSDTLDLPGASVRGLEKAVLRSKVAGYVAAIGKVDGSEIEIGTRVENDHLLAVLDIPEMKNTLAEKQALVAQADSDVAQATAAIAESQAQVLQRKAREQQVRAHRVEKEALLKLAETRLARMQRLHKGGNLAEESLDEATFEVEAAQAAIVSIDADVAAAAIDVKAAEASVNKTLADKDSTTAKVAVAQASLDHVKTMMEYSTIRAPFAGIITNRMVDHGSFVASGDSSSAKPVFELTRIDRVRVVVSVPNNKVTSVAPGMIATFHTIGGLAGKAFAGKITRTAGTLDEKTRSMRIEVELTNPVKEVRTGEEIVLKPGLFGTLSIETQSWTDDSPLAVIPTSALGSSGNENYFVVVLNGEKPQRKDVTVVFNDAISVGVAGDVKAGDKVLISGLKEYK